MNFSKLNTLIGWLVFLVAFVTYTATVEQTASFWDCGEFIAVSYKLEVPHPPGAPFFLLVGRMFSFLALGDTQQVAFAINMLSVTASAFTILFLFWTITLLARKIFQEDESGAPHGGDKIAVLGAGAIGALAYTFSDSFWFSAVEAEVYGLSSFFTAFVIWAMLKWERVKDEAEANRWILLIAYMMGLSIGVHLLNLLATPALALIYYYRKTENPTWPGVAKALGVGLAILFFINGIIPGLPSIAGKFEILFVNSFGLPFGMGAALFAAMVFGGVIYGILWSMKQSKVVYNVAFLALAFILIGYSSYTLVLIRSNFNPPIDENNPEDAMSFVSYLKREQYGDRPLLFGHHFASKRVDTEQGSPVYQKGKEEYEIVDHRLTPVYEDNGKMLLPRIYSQQGSHVQLYREKLGLREGEEPRMIHNLRYLFSHQIGHMFFRYFMWNFAGRQHDDKEAGWTTPFSPATDLPEDLARNKSRNNFYMLPLLLGILGFFFQLRRQEGGWLFTTLIFLIMGVGLVFYLNSPPVEPRERDYVYVGAFYAFAIWIGFGVLALYELLRKTISGVGGAGAAIVISAIVPFLMGFQGWDNHNRTGRFLSVDQARNALASCAPNAILFTGGDNDTFPLWYVQEVEGFRTDVRVVVLSYFATDWYVDQAKMKMNESEPLPISFPRELYRQGTNDFLPVYEDDRAKNGIDLDTYLKLIRKNDKRVKAPLVDGTEAFILPSKKLVLKVDSAEVVKIPGLIPEGKEDRIVDQIEVKVKGSHILKSDLMILDLIAGNWERPIYFNNTSAHTTNLELRDYLQMEGMTYRFTPIKASIPGETGEVNTKKMLENLEKFQFRGCQDPSTFNDEEYKKFAANFRNLYYRLAYELMVKGQREKSKEVLDKALATFPDEVIPYNYYMPRYAELYMLLGDDETAKHLTEVVGNRAIENLEFLLKHNLVNFNYQDMRDRSLMILSQLAQGFDRAQQRAERRIRQLEATGTDPDELKELQSRLQFFQESNKKYGDAFDRLYPKITRY